ncbi:MAG TPA: DegV family protein [Anaerolineae bacterium]|nr:DegV family protein [Anaerolineae bacterium]
MIHIITDSTSGLPAALAQQYHIPVIPQVILFGDESYLEGVEMDHATFLRRLRAAKELPKTAAPPPGLFVEQFQRLAGLGNTVLCIHPSAELSGTVRSALTAAADFPEADIRVLDTRTVASPLAALVLLAAQWAEQGEDADTIMGRLQALIPRSHLYFLVDTLEYLQKGGRIGGAAALIGSVLQVKPILELRNGRVEPLERERTQRKALARLKELVLASAAHGPESHLSVLHAGAPEAARALAADLGQQLGVSDVMIMDLTPAIVTHAGPGVLGVGFFAEG